ncbi:NAD(P)-dependent oxidoreductase [Roseobacter sp. HKCCA0434]|uniref:NAD(P)-dependent oxidoreductase n=1 Tax=Roseobacter sp. HKCCA0434 TaxID=3079297 RepID=UPI00290586D4|nr:NAD(P)-binding domain-containing protein [Roseobacter sp. HKCCA0434]
MKVAVAGCGRMGGPMAAALAEAGFDVAGYDVVAKPYPFMVERVALADRQVILSVVRDAAETDALLFGDGIAELPALEVLVICSTLSPVYVRGLRERVPSRVALVDAPMSGAVIGAEQRRLSFMLGGETAVLDRLQPLFDAMGTKFHRMGDYGAGMVAKVCNNLVAASSTVATRQALDWAAAQGLGRAELLALMHDSSGQTWLGSGFDEIEFAGAGFAPDNTIGILAKDVAAAQGAAPEGADLAYSEALIAAIRKLRPLD